MPTLPDPDELETGEWIDAYLSHQRQTGWSSRQLHIEAVFANSFCHRFNSLRLS